MFDPWGDIYADWMPAFAAFFFMLAAIELVFAWFKAAETEAAPGSEQ